MGRMGRWWWWWWWGWGGAGWGGEQEEAKQRVSGGEASDGSRGVVKM
jgi:hypothetical protein